MVNAVYEDKTLIFIGAMFWEKLFSRHQAVNKADSLLTSTLQRRFPKCILPYLVDSSWQNKISYFDQL